MGFRQYMKTETTTTQIFKQVEDHISDLKFKVKEVERKAKFEAIKLLQKNYGLIEDLQDPYEIKQKMLDFRKNLMEEIKG